MVAILFATSNKDEAFNCGSREDQVTVETLTILRCFAIIVFITTDGKLMS